MGCISTRWHLTNDTTSANTWRIRWFHYYILVNSRETNIGLSIVKKLRNDEFSFNTKILILIIILKHLSNIEKIFQLGLSRSTLKGWMYNFVSSFRPRNWLANYLNGLANTEQVYIYTLYLLTIYRQWFTTDPDCLCWLMLTLKGYVKIAKVSNCHNFHRHTYFKNRLAKLKPYLLHLQGLMLMPLNYVKRLTSRT